jgi:hypothetical protein
MTIKNADVPAMPQDRGIWVDGIGDCPSLATGLTKREMMAMHIMTGLCSKYGAAFDTDTAQDAVRMADFLLAELERTK